MLEYLLAPPALLASHRVNSFSWQGSLGLNFRPAQSHLSVDIGYRYFDGGKFEGPSLVYTNSAGWLSAPPWRGRLKANQGFVEFKYSHKHHWMMWCIVQKFYFNKN